MEKQCLRLAVLCVGMAIVWVLIHTGLAMFDESDRIFKGLFKPTYYPWLLSEEELARRTPEEKEHYAARYRSERRERLDRSFLLGYVGIVLLLAAPATVYGMERLFARMEEDDI